MFDTLLQPFLKRVRRISVSDAPHVIVDISARTPVVIPNGVAVSHTPMP